MMRQRLLSLAIGTALVFTAATAGAQAPPPYGPGITLEQAKKVDGGRGGGGQEEQLARGDHDSRFGR